MKSNKLYLIFFIAFLLSCDSDLGYRDQEMQQVKVFKSEQTNINGGIREKLFVFENELSKKLLAQEKVNQNYKVTRSAFRKSCASC